MLAGRRGILSVLLIVVAGALLVSCGGQQQQQTENGEEESMASPTEESTMEQTGMEAAVAPQVEGMVVVASDYGVDETISRLEQRIEEGPAMVVTTVNHAQAAEEAGLELRPTTLLVFGNPQAGTGLIQSSRTMGIDLPQKFLAWEDESGQTWLAYNDIFYLAERHGITGMDEQLRTISSTLRNLAEATAGNTMQQPAQSGETTMEETAADATSPVEGLMTVESESDFAGTVENVESAIEEQGLNLVTTVDHSENAASVGEELPPTTLFIFGNPQAGTPLMQSSQTVGIDLPQKMLVWEDESGQVNISYNDPEYLADRHDLEGVDEQIEMISAALESLAAAGAEATAEETTG